MSDRDKTSQVGIDGSVETGGGSIAGRDVFNIALNIVQEKFPKGDPFPQELEASYSSLKILISTLRAWKEVHNSLDDIRSRFDQFRLPVEREHARRKVLLHKNIKTYWRPVSGKIELFTARMKQSENIEKQFAESKIKPYDDRMDDVIACQKASFNLISLADDLNIHIQETYHLQSRPFLSPEYEHKLQNIRSHLGLRNNWWFRLTEMTDEFDHLNTESMYLADKLLRSTADYLLEFSHIYFGIKKQ